MRGAKRVKVGADRCGLLRSAKKQDIDLRRRKSSRASGRLYAFPLPHSDLNCSGRVSLFYSAERCSVTELLWRKWRRLRNICTLAFQPFWTLIHMLTSATLSGEGERFSVTPWLQYFRRPSSSPYGLVLNAL